MTTQTQPGPREQCQVCLHSVLVVKGHLARHLDMRTATKPRRECPGSGRQCL